MDLTQFTSKKENKKKEIILDNKDILVEKQGDEQIVTIKTKEGLGKYQNSLFLAPTHEKICDTEDEIQEFFEKSIKENVEGLMIKNLKSKYSSGLRTGAMAKLKETKEDIDCVILKAEYGQGKRAGYYSSFYIGVKGDTEDEYLTIGKVSSGIKELGEEGASLKRITELLEPIKISEEDSISSFEPKIVIQVKYQEIQKSPTYNSGYALRFPRIIMLREDKNLDEINSIEDIERFV